jgi:hypothetical protein
LLQHTKAGKNIPTANKKNQPNCHKIYRMTIKNTKFAVKLPNGHEIHQHLPLQDPPKFTQMWIFGLIKYHLATLLATTLKSPSHPPSFRVTR